MAERGEKARIFNRKTIVLYIIGGITYGEMACLREIAKSYGIELLVCTTKMINYTDFLDIFF